MKEKERKAKSKKERPNQFLKYTGMATQMAVIILAGVFGGLYLDEKYPSETPWFTLTFSLLSVFLALYMTIKDLMK